MAESKIIANSKKYGRVEILVSPCDAYYLSQFRWHVRDGFCGVRYAYRHETVVRDGKRPGYQMHRVIMDAPKGMEVDHINGDGLDNRRENLRICTPSENQSNRNHKVYGVSKYIGVSRNGSGWRARTRIGGYRMSDGRRSVTHIGTFRTEEEAFRARQEFIKNNGGK